MKKKEILQLMEYKRHTIISRYGKKTEYYLLVDKLDNPMEKILDIKELKNELDIIKCEFERIKSIRKISEDYVCEHEEEVKNINCDHPIVFGSGGFGYHYSCALCSKEVNEINNKLTILDDDEDDYPKRLTEYHEVKERYDELYELISEALENFDDEDEVCFNFKNFFGYKVGVMTKVKK